MRAEHALKVAENLIVEANPTFAVEIKSHRWEYSLGSIRCHWCDTPLETGQRRFITCAFRENE